MRKVAYYPGCSHNGTGKPFEVSLKRVFSHLGIELVEIPDWNCCGASSAHIWDEKLSHALPARNLALAENISDVVLTPCIACYSRLFTTNEEMRKGKEIFADVNSIISPLKYGGGVEVMNVVEFLWKEVGIPRISKEVRKRFDGKVFLAYYGCLLTRVTSGIPYDDPENPSSMEEIIQTTGAYSPDWSYKMKCCGASLALIKESIGMDFSNLVLKAAQEMKADAIITACPLCQLNLDFLQIKLGELKAHRFNIPILFITELLATSFGLDLPVGILKSHFVDPRPILGGV